MDAPPAIEYVIQVEHPQEGWRELYRSSDEADARRVWGHLPEVGIGARARLLEVAVCAPTSRARPRHEEDATMSEQTIRAGYVLTSADAVLVQVRERLGWRLER